MWAWGICPVDVDATVDDVITGTTIKDFCDVIDTSNLVVYFHNLAFDGSFIIDYLLNLGYTYVEEYPRKGQFTALISSMAKFYQITVVWRTGARTEFRDSLKKLPMSVDRIAKSFKMPVSKLSIDYAEYRAPDHELTDLEKEYVAVDVVIVARAVAIQLAEGMTKLTVGSDSLAEFKKLFGAKMFTRTFPILGPSMDADIRKAYRGGWTYCDERIQGRTLGSRATCPPSHRCYLNRGRGPVGSVYDVNSLYPFVMMDKVLPYGMPEWFDGAPEVSELFPLFIMSITFTAKLKENHLPCIQVKGSSMFGSTEYLRVIEDPITLSVTNVDLELWEEHYDFDILAYNGGWKFAGLVGFFDDFINKWAAIKASATGGLREIAKLHLNSLYGKFATNPDITGKFPVLDDGVVELVLGSPETRDPVYTAMGVFITAYARQLTITAAQTNYDNFCYADTDSIHLLSTEPPKGITVDPTRMGAWKKEYEFDAAVFWRAKAYCERHPDGRHETHIAGLPERVAQRVTLADFKVGRVFQGKLLPKRVPGGIVLTNAPYTIK